MAGENSALTWNCAALDVPVPDGTCQYTHAQARLLTFRSGAVRLKNRTVVVAVLPQPRICIIACLSNHVAQNNLLQLIHSVQATRR